MKPAAFLVLGCLIALMAVPSAMARCRIEDVPAATLLLPYFEVNLSDPTGMTTLFSINNAGAQAALAHVTVWSDLSVPVLAFNVYLTGFDVQTLNLRDILVGGNLPRTASAGEDPSDTISPQGALSQDTNFASCSGQLPPPTLPASFISHLQRSLTGQSSPIFGNLCAGQNLGDNVARGYVTVDTVSNCTLRFPSDAGYFAAGGTGDATNDNVLWGDYIYIDQNASLAEGETLVHIEADGEDPELSTTGGYTFYGRYVGWTAADNREPLATNFAVRYLNGGPFSGGSSMEVWRDSKVVQGPFTCPAMAGSRPSWYPLGQENIVIFDEQEHAIIPQPPVSAPVTDFNPFPAEAQRTLLGGSAFPLPFNFGWLSLDLNATPGEAVLNPNPPEDHAAEQAWVTVRMESQGRFSVGFDAVQIDSACSAHHAVAQQ